MKNNKNKRMCANDMMKLIIMVMFVWGIGFAVVQAAPAMQTVVHKVLTVYQNSTGPIQPMAAVPAVSPNSSEIEGAMIAYAIGSNTGTIGFSAGTQPGQLNLMPLDMIVYAYSPGPSSMSIKLFCYVVGC